MSTVIISNGFNKFPLAVAASEASRCGLLAQLLTGAYPTSRIKTVVKHTLFAGSERIARLLDREEALDESFVRALWGPEAIHVLATYSELLPPLRPHASALKALSLKLYGRQAARFIMGAGHTARIYHYRSGFGQESVAVAKERGMVALCDHSIAHPAVLDFLVANEGRLPGKDKAAPIAPLWRAVARDIDQADHVVVNSHFVKETFLNEGWDSSRVHVVYMGVEDEFLDWISDRSRDAAVMPDVRLLFAGTVERRKGAHVLLSALRTLDDVPWRLEIIGPIAPEIRANYNDVLRDPRVELVGTVRTQELARRMAAADAFVFPSLAEGSARVVFKALAAGCYVITTSNAGSIVEHDVHGALVPPGDSTALADVIRIAEADRALLRDVGRANAELIRARFRQQHYGAALARLYDSLLRNTAGSAAATSRPCTNVELSSSTRPEEHVR